MFSEKLEGLLCALPKSIVAELRKMAASYYRFEMRLSEIRIRAERVSSLTLDARNVPLPVAVTAEELTETVKLLCRGSVYAYTQSLCEGYINYTGGYRIGVCGRAVINDGCLTGIGEITSVCIRISHNISGAGSFAVDVWNRCGKRGILVYSPPGIGKTTLLRDLAVQLSSGAEAIRVAVIDSRAEICGEYIPRECLIDVLVGYPKDVGIEIATRTLSPELIICDEIGGFDEAESILSVQSAGVPLIASAHGSSLADVTERPAIKILSSNGVFAAYIGITRNSDLTYSYHADFI